MSILYQFNVKYIGFVHADYSKGFGGKYGVQKDRVDKSAHGWDYQETVVKHESQTGNYKFIHQV